MAAKRKILIVEDLYILYEELTDFFEQKGFEIIGHDDGRAVDTYEDAVQLLNKYEPDIVILDIKLKSKKDGLELAAYVKEYFHSLIIILTAYGNDENAERATMLGLINFLLKVPKPVDKDQLWMTVKMNLPNLYKGDMRKRQGDFFKVREIDTSKLNEKNKSETATDSLGMEIFIKWETIIYIRSYNANVSDGNNNILLYTPTETTGYIYRSTLKNMMERLPVQFVQFDKFTIVNLQHVTAKGSRKGIHYIGKIAFEIKPGFEEEANRRIDFFFGNP